MGFQWVEIWNAVAIKKVCFNQKFLYTERTASDECARRASGTGSELILKKSKQHWLLRCSSSHMFFKKGVLKNFVGVCWSLSFTQGCKCFPVKFAKFLRALFFPNTSGGCF